ncbi:hypothetical protein [Paenibacillus sp. Z6-24]
MTEVTSREDNRSLIHFAKFIFGRVDVIFLKASIMPGSPVSVLQIEDWEKTIYRKIKRLKPQNKRLLPAMSRTADDTVHTIKFGNPRMSYICALVR